MVVIEHIFHFDRHGRDAQNSITSIHDFPFPRYKYIFALGKENLLRLSRLAGESEKF